ncbi:MAG: hypothetical protein AAFQ32_00620 [Pseudomonadota bacterium]
MRARDTGKGTDRPLLHGPRRIGIGVEQAELAGHHAKVKGGGVLHLIPNDRNFQITRSGKTSVPGHAGRILFTDKQSIWQGPDRPAEQRNALPFGGYKKTCGHLSVSSSKALQKLRELGFNKLHIYDAELFKDVPR